MKVITRDLTKYGLMFALLSVSFCAFKKDKDGLVVIGKPAAKNIEK